MRVNIGWNVSQVSSGRDPSRDSGQALGIIRLVSSAGCTDGDGERGGRVVVEQRANVGLSESNCADGGNELSEHGIECAEGAAVRLSDVIPAGVLRNKDAMQQVLVLHSLH